MIEVATYPEKLIETSTKLNSLAKVDIVGKRPDGISKLEQCVYL